jgi:hypothetical protein
MPSSTYHAIERRGERLERLHGLELPDIGFVGVDDRFLCLGVRVGLVRELLGDDLLLQQDVVAVGGQRSDLQISPHARQCRFRLAELLVKIGRIDGGQYLSGLDLRSNIVVPTLYVTVHAGKDRGLVVGLDVAGQREGLMRTARERPSEGDSRSSLRISPLHDFLLALGALNEAVADNDARHQCRAGGGGPKAPLAWRLDVFGGHFLLLFT